MSTLVKCRICGHVHDPEDGRCDAHAHVGIGPCPCLGETIIPILVAAASEANEAMRLWNRSGMEWREVDRIFAHLESVLREVKALDRGDCCEKCDGTGRYRDPRIWGTMPGSATCARCDGQGFQARP